MGFQVSAGVNVSEIDLTTVVPAVSTTEGALAGVFRWGPVGQRILIESEDELVARFGKPADFNFETFFTGSNFLAYGNKLFNVRVANTSLTFSGIGVLPGTTAVAGATNSIKNKDDYDSRTSFDANVAYIAKYPGSLGNSIRVSVCDSPVGYSQNVFTLTTVTSANLSIPFIVGTNTAIATTGDSANAAAFASAMSNNTILRVGNSAIGFQELKIINNVVVGSAVTLYFSTSYRLSANVTANSVTTANSNATNGVKIERNWEFYKNVDSAPTTSQYTADRGGAGDELHVVVVDHLGGITGVPGTILETFPNLSLATDAKTSDGSTLYYKTVINDQSNYVWTATDRPGRLSNTAVNFAATGNTYPLNIAFASGTDGESESNVAISVELSGYDLFRSAEQIDVSLILTGKNTRAATKSNYIIDNICESRKDCIALISPDKAAVVNNIGEITADLTAFRNNITSTSYAVIDSGYKYMYDKYNDTYRYVPLNGDIGGLIVRTDTVRDPWFSPAGFNRGVIKNVVKLAYNPSKTDRDILYKAGINPVVTFPGQGTLLYGDKTALTKPSAFDRINVRRLFITLEKAIATASKFTLFEFNDTFTRAQFRNLVEPFLRDVQGRRGIYDYRVICDETNNTGEVIDRNEFVGDIYIKPARSINFIQLNFVAVRTGVEFSEIVGSF